jgi:L-asparaginase II
VIVEVGRSGLVEALHPVTAAAVDSDGGLLGSFGSDLDREFFGRSSFKPFQTVASQRNGAGLGPEQTAVATSSHGGQPVHVSYVREMLTQRGLTEEALRCPPDRPSSDSADRLAASMGRIERESVFHNCSGKHAALLRACVSRGWPTDYTSSSHPIQQEVVDIVEEASGRSVGPLGIDGCGVPTLRTDVAALARSFASLPRDPDSKAVLEQSTRFASLTADGDRRETEVARWLPAFVKAGAAGCIAAAWTEAGVGVAAKAWSGDPAAAAVALVAMADRIGLVSSHQRSALDEVMSPTVLGGGAPVGRYRLVGS